MKRHINRVNLCDISIDLLNNFDEKNWKNESLEKVIEKVKLAHHLENNLEKNNDLIQKEEHNNNNNNNNNNNELNEIDKIFNNVDFNNEYNNQLFLEKNIEIVIKDKYLNKKNNNNQTNNNIDNEINNNLDNQSNNNIENQPQKSESLVVYNNNNNNKNDNQCVYCQKIYSRKDSLNRHLQSCLVKYLKEKEIKNKIKDDKYKKGLKENKNNLQILPYQKKKIQDWELYSSSLIQYTPIQYTDFSYYKGVCLTEMPFEDDFRDNHLTNDTKIRLFTSIHYPSLLYELMKNQHNVNVVPENKDTSIVYKKNGFVRVNNDILTLETTLKLKKYFLKNYLEIKKFHPLIDTELYSVISDAIYKSILKKADQDYKLEYIKIYDNYKDTFKIEDIIRENKFLVEEANMKDFIFKKQFIFF